MARKKSVKKRLNELKKKNSNVKRVPLKRTITDITDIFDPEKQLFYSGFALTDNMNSVLFFIDNEFIEKNSLTKRLEQFNLNEADLQIQFNKNKILRPEITEDNYIFEDIGFVDKKIVNWFVQQHPKCAFYQVTKWFDKEVNTLLIILNEPHGKPVGVVKTFY